MSFIKKRIPSNARVIRCNEFTVEHDWSLEGNESTSNLVYPDSNSITLIFTKGLQFGNNEDDPTRLTADLMGGRSWARGDCDLFVFDS